MWRKVPFTEKALRVKAKRGETADQLKEEMRKSLEECKEEMRDMLRQQQLYIDDIRRYVKDYYWENRHGNWSEIATRSFRFKLSLRKGIKCGVCFVSPVVSVESVVKTI